MGKLLLCATVLTGTAAAGTLVLLAGAHRHKTLGTLAGARSMWFTSPVLTPTLTT